MARLIRATLLFLPLGVCGLPRFLPTVPLLDGGRYHTFVGTVPSHKGHTVKFCHIAGDGLFIGPGWRWLWEHGSSVRVFASCRRPLLSTFLTDHAGNGFASVKWDVLPGLVLAGPWRFR
eukprot:s6458_g3.t1